MTDIWTRRLLVMFSGVCGGAYLFMFTGRLITYSSDYLIAVFTFFATVGFSVFISFVIISPNRTKHLIILKTKRSIVIISIILVGVSFALMYTSVGINPILHAIYSDEYMQKTAYESEIVQTYLEMYPENSIRFVDYQGAPPAMVLEMEENQRMVRLMIGGFESEQLGIGFACVSTFPNNDNLFYVNVKSINDITENLCFTK